MAPTRNLNASLMNVAIDALKVAKELSQDVSFRHRHCDLGGSRATNVGNRKLGKVLHDAVS